MLIPEKINNFNAYTETATVANRALGVTDEVTLPKLESLTETLNMAGLAGEMDSPVVGQFKSCQMEIPFSNITESMFKIAADDKNPLILRAAQEVVDTTTNAKSYVGLVVTIRGMTKELDFGNLKKGGYGNPKITKELTYYKVEKDGSTLFEIDKWGTKCVINGVEVSKGITDLI